MKRTWNLLVAVLAVVLMTATATAGTTVYGDGDFVETDWTTSVLTAGGGGSGSWSLMPTGGNPDAFRRNTIDLLGEAAVAVAALRNDAIYDPATQGAIGALDYSEDSRLIQGNAPGIFSWPLVAQGGTFYVASGIFADTVDWTTKSASGLTAADFGRLTATLTVVPGDNPDFTTSGGLLQFGYAHMYASEASETAMSDIDNWTVTIDTVGAIGTCGPGAVNVGCGPRADVLRLNGSTGGTERIVTVSTSGAISATISEPPMLVGDGRDVRCVVYAWGGEPALSDVVMVPQGLGTMCYGPFITATKSPAKIWNSIGITAKLGIDNGPGAEPLISDGTAFEFLSLPNGLGNPVTATLQGIIDDPCTQGNLPYSVTNGLTLRVEP